MSQPNLEELQKTAISFIKDAGKNPTEIISIGSSSKGTTIVVFVDETGDRLLAEISDTDTQIFEMND
jgi:hypothetical protein